uniref:Uncharacterized protein n=1 Tax=Chromera velia CCMP2878 TaxID=1169474 RepID=A0A0G4GGR5_9ALVE|eukprot:Cvel_21833.t1-p1 / transcript=Cvel_21833.t1 / gene=Cvel_21833 / organism=Chromera_velia_CCMP2878 / gene_product=hypothetical protein / transcript_product=hypothetical protein / location=Cvel_scaffold2084:18802-19851(-) / protein_length=350 / sequence_SO=supercontig / SO=protein_coding / is_pseudo=false
MPAAADAPMSFATDSEGAIRSQDSQTDGIPKCSDHINVASCGTLTDGSRASATSRNANNTCNNTGSGCESDIDTENPSPTGETERDNHLSNGDPEICFAGLPRFEDSVFELIEVPDFSSHPVHVSGSSGKQKLTLTEYEGTATTAGAVGYSFVGTGTCVRLSLSTYGHEGTLSEVPSAGATSLSKLSVFFRDSHLCDDLTCCAAPEQGETPVASCFEGGREVELQTVEGGEYFTLISSVSHDFTLSFDTFAGPCVSCPEGHAHMRGDVDDNVCELEVEEEEKGEVVEIRWEEEEKEMARKRHEMELGTQSEMQEVQAMKNRSLFEGEGGTENVCTGPGVSCSARAEIMSK